MTVSISFAAAISQESYWFLITEFLNLNLTTGESSIHEETLSFSAFAASPFVLNRGYFIPVLIATPTPIHRVFKNSSNHYKSIQAN